MKTWNKKKRMQSNLLTIFVLTGWNDVILDTVDKISY